MKRGQTKCRCFSLFLLVEQEHNGLQMRQTNTSNT